VTDTPTAVTDTDVQHAMDGYWDGRAPAYDDHQQRTQTPPIRAFWRDLWRDALPAAPVDVLDAGTGSGEVAVLLAELGHRVTGIDTADGMLTIARDRAVAATFAPVWQQGDAVAPPFGPATFDVVSSRYVLWTLRDPLTALRNWHGVLRPGGRLVAVDGNWFPQGIHRSDGGPADKLPDFQRAYDRDVAASLPLAEQDSMAVAAATIEAAGFVDVTVTPLPELERLQRAADVDSDHEITQQFLVTATKR